MLTVIRDMMDNDKKLSILVVMPCYLPATIYGGPVFCVHNMNKWLVREGHSVTVFTTDADGDTNLNVPLSTDVNVDGVSVHYFSRLANNKFFFSWDLTRAIIAKSNDFDIVHINWMYTYPTLITSRICIAKKQPYIISPHGMLDREAFRIKSKIKKFLYYNLLEKRTLQNATTIHYASIGERKNSIFQEEVPIEVVANGVEKISFPVANGSLEGDLSLPDLSTKSPVVVTLGRLNYIKGFDNLLLAWADFIKQYPDAHLIIAGPSDGSYGEILYELARVLDLEEHVTFTGMVQPENKYSLLSLSSFYVCSSHLESFGMSIVEAMSIGIPVLVTDRVNINADIIQSGAGVVSSTDPQDICRGLVNMTKSKIRLKTMGKRAKELVENRYMSDVVQIEMVSLYRTAYSRHNERHGAST